MTSAGSIRRVSFKYDPFGRRIYKSSSSRGTSIYEYDLDNLVEETTTGGGVVARYAHGLNIDEPLAELRSSTTNYYEADGLGSVTSLSNSAGALAQTYGYDSFGKQTNSSGSLTNPFEYTGREFDSETGLYYYRARYYDPATGRFLLEDPLRAISWGINFYNYVLNNPINLIDSRGLSPDCPCSNVPQFRLVPISDCSYKGYRRIVYTLQGSGANKWWVTEHQNPTGWAPATPGSPEGQSTGDQGMFDDTIFGLNSGNSKQSFTVSPEDPTKNPNTPACSVNVQLPSGPNGQPQDFGTLGVFHGGASGFTFINGNSSGWVPCKQEYDEPGREH